MIVNLSKDISTKEVKFIKQSLLEQSIQFTHVQTQSYNVLIIESAKEIEFLLGIQGVKSIDNIEGPLQLTTKNWKEEKTIVNVKNSPIGKDFTIIMGPCSIQNEHQIAKIADFLKSQNIFIIRGGAFKPRSTPYVFQGYGLEVLKILHAIASKYGLNTVSEVVEPHQLELMYDYVDIFQVGTRNCQNVALLKALGEARKPVLLKRGFGNTLEEFLGSAEYIYSKGNENIILCERGIRSFEKSYRNTLDINAIPFLKQKTHLPVFIDPSHGTGLRSIVESIALAGAAAGADGVMIEINDIPEESITDSAQTLNFSDASNLIKRIKKVSELIRRDDF
jgi:3-deoxy-7-phosphoheptulonate synthase